MQCPVYIILLSYISQIGVHPTFAIEQQPFELSTATEQEYTVTGVIMQSVVLPCKAILLIMEPERVRKKREVCSDLILNIILNR